MTLFAPAYRLTLYAPRSTDATEATILTPAAGAPHSDQFKVTTLGALAGWRPYLGMPSGRSGRIDVLTKRTDVGQLVFPLLDFRLSSGNASRWVSAFFGDSLGRIRVLGLKAFAEESLDGGVSWTALWTGRCQTLTSDGKLGWRLMVSDMSEDLKALCFVGTPHASVQGYAGLMTLLPLGVQAPYGPLVPPAPLGASALTVYLGLGIGVLLGPEAQGSLTNLVTQELLQGTVNYGGAGTFFNLADFHFVPNNASSLRVVVRHLSGALAGFTGTYRVGYLITALRAGGTYYVTTLEIEPLEDSGAPGYLALPANGVSLELLATYREAVIDETQPLLIGDQHPVQHIKDVALGYYGWLYKYGEARPGGKNLGDPKRSVVPNAAAFAALLADPSWGVARLLASESEEGSDVVEMLCEGHQLGYYFNGAGELVPVDLRIPSSIPGPTLTDADVVADEDFSWEVDRSQSVQRVNAKYYYDYHTPIDDQLQRGATLPSVADALLKPIESVLEVLDVGSADLGDQLVDVDAKSFRYMDGEVLNGVTRADAVRAALEASVRSLTYPLGSGGMYASLQLRRGGLGASLAPGMMCTVQVSWLPDPWTNQRGGARAMRCVELTPLGATIAARFLDYGSAAVAGVPSLGSPSQMTLNTSHGASIDVTSNAQGDIVEVQVGVLAGGAAPAADSPLWRLVATLRLTSAPPWTWSAFGAYALPAGGRIWFRARSRPGAHNRLQQPSAWVVSSSVDLTGLSAPSAPSTSAIGSTKFTLSFTPAAGQRTEVRLAQRKNELVRSEELGDAAWSTFHASVSSNATTAPDGTASADRLVEDGTNNNHTLFATTAMTIVAGEQIAVSVFAKLDARTKVRLAGRNAGNAFEANFDLSAGTLISSAGAGSGTITAAWIERDLRQPGWYRLHAVGKLNGAITTAFIEARLLNAAGSDSYAGDGASGAYFWGAQIEHAAKRTSPYIKTVAAAAYEPYQLVATLMPGVSSFEVVGVDPGTVVSVELRATDGAGGYSSTVTTSATMLAAGSDTALADLLVFQLTDFTP